LEVGRGRRQGGREDERGKGGRKGRKEVELDEEEGEKSTWGLRLGELRGKSGRSG